MKTTTLLTGLTTLILISAGCHHDTGPTETKYDGMRFTETGESTSIGRLAEAQAAAGAKQDGTLHENAFDGVTLNSLGQGKLDLIVKGTREGQPITVYLAMSHELTTSRQPAVEEYLRLHGVPDTLVAINEGFNPNVSQTAAYTLGNVYKADANGYSGAPASTGGLMGAASPGK